MKKIPLTNQTSKLLLDEHPIIIIPSLAMAIGDREAYFLQQVHYWLKINEMAKKNYHDNRYWTYNSYEGWQKQLPWLSVTTIRRIIASLKSRELLITGNYNKKGYDRTTWYSVNYEKLAEVEAAVNTMCPKWTDGSVQNEHMDVVNMNTPIPETLQEINRESTDQQEKSPAPAQSSNNGKPKSAVNELIGYYINLYRERFGYDYPVAKGKDHGFIKNLVNEHGPELVREILTEHVNTKDQWIIDRGCSLTTIQNSLPEYLNKINKAKAEEESEARQRERDRQRQEQWEREEEEKARERAEYEALPEVDKIRKKLDNDVMMLEVMKKGRDKDAQFGDVAAIDYLLKYVRRVKDRLEELKAAGGEEADQLLKEILEEEKRLERYRKGEKIKEEVPF